MKTKKIYRSAFTNMFCLALSLIMILSSAIFSKAIEPSEMVDVSYYWLKDGTLKTFSPYTQYAEEIAFNNTNPKIAVMMIHLLKAHTNSFSYDVAKDLFVMDNVTVGLDYDEIRVFNASGIYIKGNCSFEDGFHINEESPAYNGTFTVEMDPESTFTGKIYLYGQGVVIPDSQIKCGEGVTYTRTTENGVDTLTFKRGKVGAEEGTSEKASDGKTYTYPFPCGLIDP